MNDLHEPSISCSSFGVSGHAPLALRCVYCWIADQGRRVRLLCTHSVAAIAFTRGINFGLGTNRAVFHFINARSRGCSHCFPARSASRVKSARSYQQRTLTCRIADGVSDSSTPLPTSRGEPCEYTYCSSLLTSDPPVRLLPPSAPIILELFSKCRSTMTLYGQ